MGITNSRGDVPQLHLKRIVGLQLLPEMIVIIFVREISVVLIHHS